MYNTGGSENTHLSYLEVIRNKREQAREEQERKQELDRSVKATVRSSTSLTGVIKHESQKNRETIGRVQVENEDLAKSNDIHELAECIKELGEVLRPEAIDWQPVETALNRLNEQVANLPTSHPNMPEPVEEVTVKNLPDLEPTLKKIIDVLGKLKLSPVFDPKITVKPADVKVSENKIDVSPVVDAVQSLVPVLESLKTITEKKDDSKLLSAINSTTAAINSIRFPIPNYVLPFKDTDGKAAQVQLDANGSLPTASSTSKASDGYGITAISDDGTYKYFWFEADDADYYIMRKNKTTSVFTFTKGTGGYTTVYVDENSGPSGSPTWGTRGSTF